MALRKLATFGAVGAAASLIHIAVAYGAMRGLGAEVFLANVIGFGTAFLWSYFGHYFLTFRTGAAHKAAFAKFLAVAAVGFGINNLAVLVWRVVLGEGSIWAVVFGVVLAAIATFLAANFWAFARPTRP